MDNLIREIVVQDEMEWRLLHAALRRSTERLFQVDRLTQRLTRHIGIHHPDLLGSVAFTKQFEQCCCGYTGVNDVRLAVQLAGHDPQQWARL